MRPERLPEVSLLASAFFVASLIQVPMGFTTVHLVLSGLLGLLLGWTTFPVVFVGVLLQYLLFQEGGITTLGLNTFNMAAPGVVCWYLFSGLVSQKDARLVAAGGAAAGALSVLVGASLVAAAIWACGSGFRVFSLVVWAGDAVVAIIEAVVTAAIVVFLRRVRPETLDAPRLAMHKW
ncbi:MAG: cobalt transporter CbiM [Planctomycetota bacterium]|nr:MAG: cobalt transporter CbiM [Planctomycetota bacterium]